MIAVPALHHGVSVGVMAGHVPINHTFDDVQFTQREPIGVIPYALHTLPLTCREKETDRPTKSTIVEHSRQLQTVDLTDGIVVGGRI